jgi:hypothetical protein
MSRKYKIFTILFLMAPFLLLAGCTSAARQGLPVEPANNPTAVSLMVTGAQDEQATPTTEPIFTATPVPADTAVPAQAEKTAAMAALTQPQLPTANMDPLEVTQSFYDWYLDSIGDRSSGEFRNLLVGGAYQDNPLLSDAFVARVDELLTSFDKGGYDPFLQAQDIPQAMMAQSTVISGDTARVTVLRSWGPAATDAIFTHLQRINDVWVIDDVTPTDLYEPTTETPEGTVQLFYDWYIEGVRRRFEDDTIDFDFHDSDLLSESFKQHIDDARAQAEAENPALGLHYDPFLCAQDVPYHVTPDQALVDGQRSALTARTSFQDHIITIDLQLEEAGWLISNVTCNASPESTAKAFYTWYLGTIGDRSNENFRNPLAEKAYRGQPLLSDAFVERVDAMFDEQGYIGHDPFLLAQDVPINFSVDPGMEEGTAVVHFTFGPEFVSHVLVVMTQESGRWLIEDVTQMEPPRAAKTAEDDAHMADFAAYGFSFAYPAGWVLQEINQEGAGQPEDWPVVAAWLLMPPEVAEYLASESGPPDPNAPIIIPPFNIEVVSGDEEALARVYGELEEGTAGSSVETDYFLQRDPGYVHAIFAHPLREDMWIVLTDWVTAFPGREAQGEAASPAWDLLLQSIQFAK